MAGLLDMVLSQLGSGGLGAVAGQLGTSPSGAQSAITTAVNVLRGYANRSQAPLRFGLPQAEP
jgi:hypothetical protein